LSEEELIRGCLNGQAKHQNMLYEQYARKMYSVCLRYARSTADATDILQDGFIKVFMSLNTFKFEGSFEGWIRKTMVRTALRKYQRIRFEMEESGLEFLPDFGIEADAVSQLAEEELIKMIANLPDGYRVVFNMVAIEGFSHKEAADLLGIKESTSRSQLTKARQKLVEDIERRDNDERKRYLKLFDSVA
jgi:RNA polymerase sigma factor (sigma-70 family)